MSGPVFDRAAAADLMRRIESEDMEDDDADMELAPTLQAALAEIDRLTSERDQQTMEMVIADRDKLQGERDALKAQCTAHEARHDSSLRYLRDIESMAATGTQTAVMRDDGSGALRLALFRDIKGAARVAIGGDGLRISEAVEIDRLTVLAETLRADLDAARATLASVASREAVAGRLAEPDGDTGCGGEWVCSVCSDPGCGAP